MGQGLVRRLPLGSRQWSRGDCQASAAEARVPHPGGLTGICRAGGLSLGEFDAATQACGLATTMGVNSDTGIAGLTLGGGFDKVGREHGLTCDNLLAPRSCWPMAGSGSKGKRR